MSTSTLFKFVDCFRGDVLIASYPFGYGQTLEPTPPPSNESLVVGAKTNLSTERLAFPPFDGIRFVVRD